MSAFPESVTCNCVAVEGVEMMYCVESTIPHCPGVVEPGIVPVCGAPDERVMSDCCVPLAPDPAFAVEPIPAPACEAATGFNPASCDFAPGNGINKAIARMNAELNLMDR